MNDAFQYPEAWRLLHPLLVLRSAKCLSKGPSPRSLILSGRGPHWSEYLPVPPPPPSTAPRTS